MIAVSLNNVPEIPSIKIKGRHTAMKIRVVAIIADEICVDSFYADTKGVSTLSILRYIASVIITESSVIMPIAKIKLKRTKILIDKSKIYRQKKEDSRLTGKDNDGHITAERLQRKK